MPRCDHCGYAHAYKRECINCGSRNPFERRQRVRKVIGWILIIAVVIVMVRFCSRLREYDKAEDRARAAAAEAAAKESSPPPAGR